jgi:hypothetical protein
VETRTSGGVREGVDILWFELHWVGVEREALPNQHALDVFDVVLDRARPILRLVFFVSKVLVLVLMSDLQRARVAFAVSNLCGDFSAEHRHIEEDSKGFTYPDKRGIDEMNHPPREPDRHHANDDGLDEEQLPPPRRLVVGVLPQPPLPTVFVVAGHGWPLSINPPNTISLMMTQCHIWLRPPLRLSLPPLPPPDGRKEGAAAKQAYALGVEQPLVFKGPNPAFSGQESVWQSSAHPVAMSPLNRLPGSTLLTALAITDVQSLHARSP